MLLTPRTYDLAKTPDQASGKTQPSFLTLTTSWNEKAAAQRHFRKMLLVHQTGTVKVGEYTLTYTPASDRILPSPAHLHVRIRNTSAIALRAAYLHGPYTLHVAAYPSTFNPNQKVENPRRDGVPEFEPNLKAGGTWTAQLTVPEDIRETGGRANLKRTADGEFKSVTWIIEITSQIIFSNSASVNFELLISRDERSLDLGLAAVPRQGRSESGQVHDHQQGKHGHTGHPAQPKGVYSKAVKLVVDDTTSLWDKPALPEWDEEHTRNSEEGHRRHSHERRRSHHSVRRTTKKQRKIHLVVLTHGLHSNLGADMLYMKESIDATARQARESARRRRHAAREAVSQDTGLNLDGQAQSGQPDAEKDTSTAPLSGGQEDIKQEDDDDSGDEEEVVVRGFNGNVIRTERGIQYLGKRLARFVLEMTYPDQPFLPTEKTVAQKISNTLSTSKDRDSGMPHPTKSSGRRLPPRSGEQLPYKFTSISFIGHSLGGLVQTYAIAYIHKHSPQFFENIRPVNFICMASPLLGLSNENPMYVKFALDFGLVGRTGQDLGLSWRPPTLVKSGWAAIIGGLGAGNKDQDEDDPGKKPLLRILPTGPAHHVLRLFRNRTTYSNVVNDGIVPLRTSCLLFLDWRGLDKVEKARRENGLIGTVATWGWSELTGQYPSPFPSRGDVNSLESPSSVTQTSPTQDQDEVPQPSDQAVNQDDESQAATAKNEPQAHQFLQNQKRAASGHENAPAKEKPTGGLMPPALTLDGILNFFRPSTNSTKNDKKMYQRSQTVQAQQAAEAGGHTTSDNAGEERSSKRPPATRGDSIVEDPANPFSPPKTTIFESAGDILNPPVPPRSWIIDPSTRARTIFHDRVYHPEDIPPPPMKRPTRLGRSFSSDHSITSNRSDASAASVDSSGMRVEEKIARAYHKDLSWRKVLVRLEPDAHNNIIVRRMFANAYGWPVIKHLCDTHFADTYAARTRDEDEPAKDRAKGMSGAVSEHGEEVLGQRERKPPRRSASEMREATDELAPLREIQGSGEGAADAHVLKLKLKHRDTSMWDDSYFEGTTDEEDEDGYLHEGPMGNFLRPVQKNKRKGSEMSSPSTASKQKLEEGTKETEIADFLTAPPRPVDGHRGLGLTSLDPEAATASDPESAKSFTGKEPVSSPPPMEGSPLGGASTVELGLRKSVEERLGSPTASMNDRRKRSGSGSVSEQVARLSLGHSP
ncbi:hypothetical protein H2199_000349 [Coniosporium tulheliwenetii]|uniref:Uncharacterized protein n=1 Tax=Coniosporium tulheliwenetii TaxID=3383036 RepID=A0ACC2ZPW8_9PEZI|nr:hypothetical protein H2199_000349 [Cladosporium sp. JES 115]